MVQASMHKHRDLTDASTNADSSTQVLSNIDHKGFIVSCPPHHYHHWTSYCAQQQEHPSKFHHIPDVETANLGRCGRHRHTAPTEATTTTDASILCRLSNQQTRTTRGLTRAHPGIRCHRMVEVVQHFHLLPW
ncbi:hypothetical protein M422DRAFT_786147 [Sphaerobolus stellatus SS14]|uniref:Uncharacterized protein n=1 Tax=Sphaerobolus stellatus (strain SS14) TaxID=990650 RepID=A0A0C9T3U0_SPHS4|nr:hypothetical protein M422DRAFT_786147 [Sphaerobolus stellatus SS14]